MTQICHPAPRCGNTARMGVPEQPTHGAQDDTGRDATSPRERDGDGARGHEVFGELASTLTADDDGDRRYLSIKEDDPPLFAWLPVSRKIVVLFALLGALVAIPYAAPQLKYFQLTRSDTNAHAETAATPAGGPLPSTALGDALVPGETYDQQRRAHDLEAPATDHRSPIAQAPADSQIENLSAVNATTEKKPPRSIEDFSGRSLTAFFEKLSLAEQKKAGGTARILYFGDSIVASDFVTGKLRRMLQSRFGDAGHGYVLIANAWPGWFHIDVFRRATARWRVSTCVGPYIEDGLYGLGCASFVARQPGLWAEFGTATADKWGRRVARFEVEYLKQPGGGTLSLSLDGKPMAPLDTSGESSKIAWHKIDVEDGPHRLKITTTDTGPVRMFGVRMERNAPGVILNALGITGARARFLDKQDDIGWARVIQAAKPDLVCLAFGSNEVTDGRLYPLKKYRETLEAVMAQIEKAVPGKSLMLVGPPDMASKTAAGHARAMVHYIVKTQKELAKERGWAFWDQYRAMGGPGSMWAWMKAGLGAPDMFHPTGRGGNLLGTWQYRALMEAFDTYKAAQQ